jgi:hypothetical protein
MASLLVMVMVCFPIALSTEPTNVGSRYTFLFCMTSSYVVYIIVGFQPVQSKKVTNTVKILCRMASSFTRPQAKRAVVISVANAISQLGSVGGLGTYSPPSLTTAIDWGSICGLPRMCPVSANHEAS